MDYLRTCYRTRMRLWSDRPDTVPVRWFRCDAGAKPFPGRHRFSSRVWREDKTQNFPIGESQNAREYDKGLNRLGYRGLSFCGRKEAFAAGGRAGADKEIVTNADGSTPCCRMPNVNAAGAGQLGGGGWFGTYGAGGASAGGTATVATLYISPSPYPTGTSGGTAPQGPALSQLGAGGLLAGRDTLQGAAFALVALGGLLAGRDTLQGAAVALVALGGLVADGSAGALGDPIEGAGGSLAGGIGGQGDNTLIRYGWGGSLAGGSAEQGLQAIQTESGDPIQTESGDPIYPGE